MCPRADQPAPGACKARQQAGNGLGIVVGPARNGIDGDGDAAEIFADGTLAPVVVARLVAQPCQDPRGVGLHPGLPHVAPRRADDGGIGGQVLMGEHGGGPVEIVFRQAAADPVDVSRIAVVGRAHGDDGFQGRRLTRGDLQTVETAPTDADHRNLPVAPVLTRQPVDGGDTVVLFLRGIFVVDHAFAVAGAANVEPEAGIAVAGKVTMHLFIARAGAIAFAVGQIFKDQRHGPRALWQPQTPGKADAVGHGNPDILDLCQVEGIVVPNLCAHAFCHQFIGAPPSALRRAT